MNLFEGYKYNDSRNDCGVIYHIYKKIIYDAEGQPHGLWAACPQDSNCDPIESEMFPITWAQAVGYEPINNSSIAQLKRKLSEAFLKGGK